MCHFLTATVADPQALPALGAIAGRHGLAFERIDNAFVQGQLPAGSVYLRKVTSSCDCGTVIGSQGQRPVDEPDAALAREAARRRESGWSEAKVERWLEAKRGSAGRRARRAHDRADARRPEAADWLVFL